MKNGKKTSTTTSSENLKSENARNAGRWTEARFRSFIVSALRAAFRRWGPKHDALAGAFSGSKINKKSGRQAKHYQCIECAKHFPQKEVQVDHKIPIAPYKDWNEFIEKLFCEADNLQVLCKPCHKEKTKKERSS